MSEINENESQSDDSDRLSFHSALQDERISDSLSFHSALSRQDENISDEEPPSQP